MGNQKKIEKLAKCVAKIHAQNINQGEFKVYNAKWVTEQVNNTDITLKSDIVSALDTMSQIEVHNATPKEKRFLAWDIIQSDWQKDYQSGRAGSCAWDIACIINFVKNAQFSEIFLENYLRHGGEKPSLAALYANLYYVKVFEAIKSSDFENIKEITRNILVKEMFDTDIISYETLGKLNITGY